MSTLESMKEKGLDANRAKLEPLWRTQVESVFGQFTVGAADYREVASLAQHIGADYHGRFLIELIQNAEDPSRLVSSTAKYRQGARLIIIRTESEFAVLNQGKPFDLNDIGSITSIGLSTKSPETSVGNKGVGFKAVFEVTQAPEIYSAALPGGSLLESEATRFRMHTEPFSNPVLSEAINNIATEILDAHKNITKEKNISHEDLLAELKQVAPFKFPLPLTYENLQQRIAKLKISEETLSSISTMVVLPLIEGERTAEVIDKAVGELFSPDKPGKALLFLHGLDRIWFMDRRKEEVSFYQRKCKQTEELARGVRFSDVEMTWNGWNNGERGRSTRAWWVTDRRIGKDGSDPATAAREEEEIKEAAKMLHIDKWEKIRSAIISVAFPRLGTDERDLDTGLLGSDGYFSIGLPTHVSTAMPVRVDAPFHGSISRTEIDFDGQRYNKLLLDEARNLFWIGIERIKSEPTVDNRRHATLMFQHGEGKFWQELMTHSNIDGSSIILNFEGKQFITPAQVAIPSATDAKLFHSLFSNFNNWSDYGICLTDPELAINFRPVLEGICAAENLNIIEDIYLRRPQEDALSFLELNVVKNINANIKWWEEFLAWALQFTQERLTDQRILPVGQNRLAAGQDRVFLRPLTSSGQDDAVEGDTVDIDSDEDLIDELDEKFFDSMTFLDETRIRVRREPARKPLTDIARKLSPTKGGGLVRSPRKPELINDALLPYLMTVKDQPGKLVDAMSVLGMIADWLYDMKQASRDQVDNRRIYVPTGKGAWTWSSSDQVYFGEGWLDGESDRLLGSVYGMRSDGRLPSWSEFQKVMGADTDLATWRDRFERLGVLSAPKVKRIYTGTRVYLRAGSGNQLYIDGAGAGPVTEAERFWQDYLEYLCTRQSLAVKTNQSYYVRDPIWIDALEDDEKRCDVVKLMLRRPEKYQISIQIDVTRERGIDRAAMDALWIYALKSEQWSVIPTNLGPMPPNKTWQLTDDQQRSRFAQDNLCAYVEPPYSRADDLLRALGIYSPTNAPKSRIICELQNVASKLDNYPAELKRTVNTYVQTLYGWLQDRCHAITDGSETLAGITENAMPMLRNGDLVARDLSSATLIILDDEPERGKYINETETADILPLNLRGPVEAIYRELSEILQEPKLKRTRDMEINTGFVNDVSKPPIALLDYLADEFKDETQDIRLHIAALIAYGRTGQSADPQKREFKETWNLFQVTILLRGKFRDASINEAIFDCRAEPTPTLYLPISFDKYQVLRFLWLLVGPAHRMPWEAYVTRLKEGLIENFFLNEVKITAADWDLLGVSIGYSLAQRIHLCRAAMLILLRKKLTNLTAEEFLGELKRLGSDAQAIAEWLDMVPGEFEHMLTVAGQSLTNEQSIGFLKEFDLSLSDWQRARNDLGLDPIIFRESQDLYRQILSLVVGYLRAAAAQDNPDAQVLGAIDLFLEEFEQSECPESISYTTDSEAKLTVMVLDHLVGMYANGAPEAIKNSFARLAGKSSLKEILEGRIANREVLLYWKEPVTGRELDAVDTIGDLMLVAKPLAKKCEELIDESSVKANNLVLVWTEGVWANRFAALRGVRDVLSAVATRTAERLVNVRAFRDPRSWRELWDQFPELGPMGVEVPKHVPQKKESLFGEEFNENEISQILNQGGSGRIGKALVEAVPDEPEFDAMAIRARANVAAPISPTKRGGGGRTRTVHPSQINTDRIGILGEAFVYETFSRHLPGFDQTCWRSGARTRYGISDKGDDKLGYDFEYTDIEGKLTGRIDLPRCLLEVKSSTNIENIPFPISAMEWQVAEQCFQDRRNELYVIVRVLNVEDRPEIVDIIVDPVGLWHQGKLALSNRDFIVFS